MTDTSEGRYKHIVKALADGRDVCNCGRAYYNENGRCEAGCTPNQMGAAEEIAGKLADRAGDPALVWDPEPWMCIDCGTDQPGKSRPACWPIGEKGMLGPICWPCDFRRRAPKREAYVRRMLDSRSPAQPPRELARD